MGTSFGLLKTTVLPWRRAASSLSISSKAAAGRARASRLAWRMAHGAWHMAHGTWHMEKALSAPLTGHRPGRAKAVRVVRQLVWVEDRVTSGRGHLQQLATRCRSYGFPQTCRRRFDQKGGKGAPVGVRFRRIVSVGVLKMCQFELTSNSSEGGHDVSEGDEARGSVGGCA